MTGYSFREVGGLWAGDGPSAALFPGPLFSLKAETPVNLQESPFEGKSQPVGETQASPEESPF